jgi:RNA polymerase sigma factor (sigma-70 family)
MLTSIALGGRIEPPQPPRPHTSDTFDIRERTETLLRTEIAFVPNTSFVAGDLQADEAIEISNHQSDRARGADSHLPAHLARLCESELLSAEEERDLFRAFNYLKYRINVVRSQLNPESPDRSMVESAEEYLRAAERIRDRIVQANMRLVISIIKKFVTPQYSFDELLSDGIVALIQAVNKFDFDRGFRFSTYAYRAIARCAYRQVGARHKESGRFSAAIHQLAELEPGDSASQLFSTPSESELRGVLDTMLSRLDRRERFIVRRRYAMGRSRKAATFQSMATKLGVSKERVRQLENRAVGKLRKMAAEMGISDLLE